MVNIESVRVMWSRSTSLTAVFLLMLLLLALNSAGLVIDHRQITGAPVWLKPAKFAISVAIFTGTVIWLLPFLSSFPRQARWAGRILAVCLFIEMLIIDGQAARGVSSHFNFQTAFDGMLFGIMGTSIFVLWVATLWLCVLLFLQRFADSALGWALRLGMAITVVGALSGSLMTRATASQKLALRNHEKVAVIGAHTVGGPDGGEGLPGTYWSRTHGDLRVPHFLGLHGLQAVPLIYAFFIRSRYSKRAQVALVGFAAASYAAFTLLLGWQALRGQSIASPDSTTIVSLALWAAVTIAGFAGIGTQAAMTRSHA